MKAGALPRILVIDDVYGRQVSGANTDRSAICLQLMIEDMTSDQTADAVIHQPIAQAVFCRGQRPARAVVGDLVENDLQGTLELIDSGWHGRQPGTAPWALVLLDLRFKSGRVTPESEARFGEGVPGGREEDVDSSTFFGLRLLEEIQRRHPQLPVVVLSDAPRETVSQRSTVLGAVAFLSKGQASAAEKLGEYLRHHALVPDPTGKIAGNSISLLIALRSARRAALGVESLLIRGERGTGKESLARYIHCNDPRRASGPFISVDSGTLTADLYASELFGHVRGAFTSAIADSKGAIVEAQHGILFLDEIGNIDYAVQRGLLRVLQEKQVKPVGAPRPRDIDVRFVFATNGDIETCAAVENGFRLDLLDRVRQGGTIVLPPLHDRLEDLPLLVEALVRDAEHVTKGAIRRDIDPQVLAEIAAHDWPGNIRQLGNCLSAAVRARPDMEHLVPLHLDLPKRSASHLSVVRTGTSVQSLSLKELIAAMELVSPETTAPNQLLGQYSELESAFARLAMKYLRASLTAVRKPTVKSPAGEVLVQPAVRLMLGTNVSASQAYDFIIRLRNLSAPVVEEWDHDDMLRLVFERARQQRRPGRGRFRIEQKKESTHG